MSKKDKRASRLSSSSRPVKKVRFAKPLVQESANTVNQNVQFKVGSFTITGSTSTVPMQRVFGMINSDLNSCPGSSAQQQPKNTMVNGAVSTFEFSNDWSTVGSMACSRCLGFGHSSWACSSQICCKSCFSYGHLVKR